jgi:hypothetical protein
MSGKVCELSSEHGTDSVVAACDNDGVAGSLFCVAWMKKAPPERFPAGLRRLCVRFRQSYLLLKSKNHQPSSHSKLTLRHPSGTWG